MPATDEYQGYLRSDLRYAFDGVVQDDDDARQVITQLNFASARGHW